MRSRLLPIFLAGFAAGLALIDPPRSTGQDPGDEAPPAGVEVQARGAVHEAYAEPNRTQAVPGPVVQKDPPRLIEEAPPDEKPEGDNIVWIPGYWSWDEETTNFVWISGFWRAVPPGRTWIPGSWQAAGAGHRWVSGYWGVTGQEETQYLPRPPESIDNGPSTPAPAENYSYVPGNWYYQTTRYVWRPGYWAGYRPGWVWTPSCYRWTPCGFIYVPGFWDVPLLDRGLLFAPVCFTSAVYLNPGFVYRPSYCIQPDFLCGALFVRRGFGGGYYFGDYFGPRYRSGFTSWNNFRFGGGVGRDLNFGYYRNAYRGHPGWERGLTGLYAGRFAGTIAAPPRTLVQQRTVINNIVVNKTTNNIVNKNVNITNIQNSTVLAPVKNIKKVNVTALSSLAGAKPPAAVTKDLRVARLSPAQLKEEKQGITRFQAIAKERRNTEAKLVAKAPKESAAPIRAKLDLPKGTPPARLVKTPTPPPAPNRVKGEPNQEGKPGVVPAPKPGTTPPPAPKPGGMKPPAPKPGTTPPPAPKPGGTAPSPAPKPGTAPPPAPKPGTTPPPPTKPGGTKPPPPAPKPGTPPPAPKPGTLPPPKPEKAPPPPKQTAPPPKPMPPAQKPATPPPAPKPTPPPAPRPAPPPPPPAPKPRATPPPPAPRPAPPPPPARPDKPKGR